MMQEGTVERLTAVDEARLLYERAVWDYWKEENPPTALEAAVDAAFDRLRRALIEDYEWQNSRS